MTDEERQRQMDFILTQQAQLTATVGRLADKVDRTADSVGALLVIAEMHDREIATTNDAQTRSDERLNALISTVERIISEGRNGKL